MSQLYATIGLPRSGKGTLCEKLKKENPNLVVLSGDTFRKALYDGIYNRSAEPYIFAGIDLAAKALLLDGYDVLIDETATDIRTCLRYLSIDPYCKFIYMQTSKEECIRRALMHKQHYLVSVIEWQAKNLQLLQPHIDNDFKEFREIEKQRKIRGIGEPNCQPPELSQLLSGLTNQAIK